MMNDGVKSNIRAMKPETENGKTYHIRVGNGHHAAAWFSGTSHGDIKELGGQ